MCKQGRFKILQKEHSARCIDILLHDHTPVHVILKTDVTPVVRRLPLVHFKENCDHSIRIFVCSKRVDTFVYELLIVYVLGCIGIEKCSCHIQLFEEVDDICILESLIYVLNRSFDVNLELLSNGGRIEITLQNKVIYATNIV